MVFGDVVDVAVEGHRVGHADSVRMVDEPLPPPSVTDDVEVQAGKARPQLGHRIQRILNLLVRHQP
ncbi:Uncharacterised protein [Mycobacterium tuberculosis]|nr:Uncharacterised protein [Mycobacterium tuberculosis]